MRIAHFSAGATSAIAAIIGKPDRIVYAETRSEHPDNQRFIAEVERHLGLKVTRFGSEKYKDTWDVWERRKYVAGHHGAPCSLALKRVPLEPLERIPGATHIIGYTASERQRASRLRRLKPDVAWEFPLIDAGISSEGARAILESIGIKPPITYELGMPHANCIPCSKATSPKYWAFIREHFPAEFERYDDLTYGLEFKQIRLKGQMIYLRDLPKEIKPNAAEAPGCDLLCEIAKAQISGV